MPTLRALDQLKAANAAWQTALAGAYAWGLTVAPAAWSHSAPGAARVVAVFAPLALLIGVAVHRRGDAARRVALWGFVLACAGVWAAVPAALGPLRVDAAHGLLGMLAWALFGLTSAAPGRSAPLEPVDVRRAPPTVPPRESLATGDGLYVLIGAIAAGAFQFVGWGVPTVERALLVRGVVLAAGLAVIATSAELAIARHRRTAERGRSAPRPWRAVLPYLVALAILALAGAVSFARGW